MPHPTPSDRDFPARPGSPLLEGATLARLERLLALARRARPRRRRGLRLPGRGLEPGARRDYSPGDDPRLVDWPAYARLERLLVKVTEELPEPRLELLLDASGSMVPGLHPAGERAALAAAALAACALAREARVEVWWGSDPPAHHRLARPGQLLALLRFLEGLRAAGRAPLRPLAERVVRGSRSRSLAVLISDGLDAPDLVTAARTLRRGGREPLVVLVPPGGELAPEQARAALSAGRAELVDAETGASRVVPFAAASLSGAEAVRAERRRELIAALEGAELPWLELPGSAPFERVALELLGGEGAT